MTSRTIAVFAAAAGSLLLVACGGGSGGGPTSPLDGVSAIDLTGAQTPQETAANQAARVPGIAARADSLLASNAYGETNDPRFPEIVLDAQCSGSSCTFTHTPSSVSLDLDSSDFDITPARVVLTRHGITTFENEGGDEDSDFRAYGAWMDHSAFAVEIDTLREDDLRVTFRFGLAGGELTGSRPGLAGAATWQGLMVGTPQTGAARGNYLQGDAMLTFDLDTNMLDAEFTDINDLDRRAAHSTTSVRFADVPVATGGTFGAGNAGNRIQGGFYGLGHAETAGVFEHSEIVGAFGARKQSLDGVSAIDLTGARAPQETVADQAARALGTFARIDSLLASNVYGETDDPASPSLLYRAVCSGNSCTFTDDQLGEFTIEAEDASELTTDDIFASSAARTILTRHGITTFEDEGSFEEGDNFRSFGAWMDHSAFLVQITDDEEVFRETNRYGIAAGDLTDSLPAGDATWRGLMVGTPQTGAARGNYLQGDALLTFDLDTSMLDAAFTDINDLDRRAAHSTTSVRFADVRVRADGTFGAGATGRGIRGGFYGPGHAETAGAFEHSGIVGAFGARKQP